MLARENVITEESLPPELLLPAELREPILPSPAPAASGPALHDRVAGGHPPAEAESTNLNLDDRERRAIVQALAHTHGNKLKAAKMLGIHRPTLYNKMKRYGIAV